MLEQYSREMLIYGPEGIKKLRSSRVAVFGIGGVGGYVVEGLARSGIGTIDIIDNDEVSLTNINRQILASHDTIGRDKVDVCEDRIHSIDPETIVNKHKCFFLPENSDEFDFSVFDYVVDAIDTVSGKIQIIVKANKECTPVISCMGMGNKIHPEMVEISDIYKTSICPLARVMRRELRKQRIEKLDVVYSKEKPTRSGSENDESIFSKHEEGDEEGYKSEIPGSTACVPPVAGFIIASVVINKLVSV